MNYRTSHMSSVCFQIPKLKGKSPADPCKKNESIIFLLYVFWLTRFLISLFFLCRFWSVASVPSRLGCVFLRSLGLTSRLCFGLCVVLYFSLFKMCLFFGSVLCVTAVVHCRVCARAPGGSSIGVASVAVCVRRACAPWKGQSFIFRTCRPRICCLSLFFFLSLCVSQMKIPSKKMAHIPVYTVGFHSTPKSQGHKSQVYKWVRARVRNGPLDRETRWFSQRLC